MDSLDILEDGYEEEYDRIQSCMDLYYDRIEETERRIAKIYDQMKMAAANLRTADEIEKMLSHFSILYQKMTYQERRELYRLFIDHIEILPKAGHDGKILKSISFRFPGQFGESPQADRKEIAGKELCFTLDCTNLKLSAERTKATYAELKRYILDNYGLKVSSLYIAQIKRKYGLEVGEQYHKPADPDKKVPVCPPAKEDAIKEALIHFKML